MTTAITPPVPLPAGTRCIGDWEADDPQPYRVVEAVHPKITDHRLTVAPSAVQWADRTVYDGRIESPHIYVYGLDEGHPLNSDQARELAAALVDAAAEIDGWADVGKPDEFRTFDGPIWTISGVQYNDGTPARVFVSGTQLRDGTVEERCIRLEGVAWRTS